MPKPSTFSIVACDLDEQAWGVAVASKFPAVGAVVPWARASAGAVATQSFANTSFGPRGLDLMASGLSAEETLAKLLEDDKEREQRQVGLVDAQGHAATFTGSECFDWAGGLTGPGYAIQGNILAGEQVVVAMQKAFVETKGILPARLYAALLAGIVRVATGVDGNRLRFMWSSPKAGTAVISIAGSITAWTITKIRSHAWVNYSNSMNCILAKAKRKSAYP